MVWRDGRLIESEPGTAPVEVGWGAFTTVGCDGGHPLLWTRHRSRLAESLRFLGAGNDVALPDEPALRELLQAGGLDGAARLKVVGQRKQPSGWTVEASVSHCEAAGPDAPPARLLLQRRQAAPPLAARISHQVPAAAGDAPHPAVFSPLGVLDVLSSTTPRPLCREPHWARHLADLATKPGETCGLTGHKTLARLPWDLARERAQREGADDALLVDEAGHVLETAIANVWLRRGCDLRTPPAPARCLPGIMRDWLLEHAGALGLQVYECDLTTEDLVGADELWISNAVIGVRKVAFVAGREWRSWRFFEDLAKLGVPAPGW